MIRGSLAVSASFSASDCSERRHAQQKSPETNAADEKLLQGPLHDFLFDPKGAERRSGGSAYVRSRRRRGRSMSRVGSSTQGRRSPSWDGVLSKSHEPTWRLRLVHRVKRSAGRGHGRIGCQANCRSPRSPFRNYIGGQLR